MVSDEFPVLHTKKVLMMFVFHTVLVTAVIVLYDWFYIFYRLFWNTDWMFAVCFGANYSFFSTVL